MDRALNKFVCVQTEIHWNQADATEVMCLHFSHRLESIWLCLDFEGWLGAANNAASIIITKLWSSL